MTRTFDKQTLFQASVSGDRRRQHRFDTTATPCYPPLTPGHAAHQDYHTTALTRMTTSTAPHNHTWPPCHTTTELDVRSIVACSYKSHISLERYRGMSHIVYDF